jgi:hypothetical protein
MYVFVGALEGSFLAILVASVVFIIVPAFWKI